VRELSFVGDSFVVEQALFVGRASVWKGFRHGPKSLVGVGHIGRCCEGFAGF